MEPIGSLLTGLALLVFIALLVLILGIGHLRARTPAPTEQGKTPIYKDWVGGRVGMSSYRGPLLNFRVYDDFLILDGLKRVIIHFANIERVELEKTWLGVGTHLTIVHHEPNAPRRILLAVSDQERVKRLIDARLPFKIA